MLILLGWAFLAIFTVGNGVCLWLWWHNQISDRAMIGITLFLSWLAMQGEAATLLLTAYTKRSVDS